MTGADPVAALQAALAAEHAAVYGYGVAGARLDGAARQSARRFWEAHRTRRDQLTALIIARRTQPAAAAAAYRLPGQITSPRAAGTVLATLEERLATAYLGLVAVDDARLQALAAMAMKEAITRAVRWRNAPPRAAFPGLDAGGLAPLPE